MLVDTLPAALSVDLDVEIPMRDGTILVADVYRPSSGKWPALLQRTPYGKRANPGTIFSPSPVTFALGGFCVVMQDTRGRGESGGDFEPFLEFEDGYDTVEWCAHQTWSSGEVAMFGSSYMAASQLQAATAQPPSLKALCPMEGSSDYFEGRSYRGGAFELGALLSSSLNVVAYDSMRRLGIDRVRSKAYREAIANILDNLPDACSHFPLRDSLDAPDSPLRDLTPWFFDWVDHDHYDEYWADRSLEPRVSSIEVPALHISSWFDQFHVGTLRNYELLRKGPTEVADAQYLLMGPWNHHAARAGGAGTTRLGDLAFGSGAALNLDGIQLSWFQKWMHGDQQAFRWPKRVRIFVMGVNQWRYVDDWPVPHAKVDQLFLGGDGHANGAESDGTLTWSQPISKGSDRFVHDPAQPVPTVGGAYQAVGGKLRHGPVDQRSIEGRLDLLNYTSDVLDADTEVVGWVEAVLWVSSDAPSADFAVRLVDVDAMGVGIGVCDGIRRVDTGTLGSGNDGPMDIRVDLGATAYAFRRGHRIRLSVSGSNFPRFDVNPTTGNRSFDEDVAQVAQQILYHSEECPSHLVLSVLPVEESS
jgi:uncharacterized protein